MCPVDPLGYGYASSMVYIFCMMNYSEQWLRRPTASFFFLGILMYKEKSIPTVTVSKHNNLASIILMLHKAESFLCCV